MGGNVQKKPVLSPVEGSVQPCPERRRREGRSRCDARSVRCVHERERREERHVCEPEGRQHGENAAGLSAWERTGMRLFSKHSFARTRPFNANPSD